LSPALNGCFSDLGLVETPDFLFFSSSLFCETTETYPGCCYHHKILFWFSIPLPLTGALSGQWETEPRFAMNAAAGWVSTTALYSPMRFCQKDN